MSSDTDDHDPSASRSLDSVLSGLRFAMIATADAQGQWRARPLAVAGQEGGRLSFLVGVDADWVEALETSGSPTTVTFSDPGKNTYVALQGSARTVDDRARIAALWNAGAGAYFEGQDDPRVRVLDVEVSYGEYWDSPSGRLGSVLQLASAALGKPVGEQGDVVV
ncbi:MAG: pyridoxamine 5-phosphate oxidase-related, FMN-binding, Gsp26 [Frankiales bacterium]|nr:pyridoxamine 5-phosphate oxidase-related, FMN-binding, Gsp26 [Frankiales bacterium]